MAEKDDKSDQISAEPTKAFFVDMLVRDVPLETAILDLVDNSVDGAKKTGKGDSFDGYTVTIELTSRRFRMVDNCGGFSREAARLYAFRFGRPSNAPRTPHSIGQFGVGMKRALFKLGRKFLVKSSTVDDEWAVSMEVDAWETQNDWHFPWADFGDKAVLSKKKPGTEIVVDKLKPEVSMKLSTDKFANEIIGLIKSKHRQFIAKGLAISVNKKHVDASDLNLIVLQDGGLQPGVDEIIFKESGKATVSVRIVVGIGASLPKQAGWYIICNGRVIVEANRTEITGWGLAEEAAGRVYMPSFHNQFAR